MALTKELIMQQEALNGLSEEQVSALVTLSANDENVVIGQRFGEVYRQMDSTIETALGIKRNGDEKTYNYLSRASKEFAERYKDYDGLKSRLGELETEKKRLEQLVKDSAADKELKTKYEGALADLTKAQEAYAELQKKYEQGVTEHKAELVALRVDGDIAHSMSGLKFKAGIPESAIETLKAAAIAKVKAMNPCYEKDAKGADVLVFRDAQGAKMVNPKNLQMPLTASELLTSELKALGVLDEGRQQTGGGTGGNGGSEVTVDLASARSRVEADAIAEKMLMERGLVRNTPEFQKEMLKIRESNKDLYAKLPLV